MLPGDGVEGLPFPEGGIVGVLASLPAQSLLSVGVENCLIIFGLPGPDKGMYHFRVSEEE